MGAVRQHFARQGKKWAIGATTGAALAAILIPHWEGEDLTAKHNSFDPAGVITVCNGITNYDWPWLKAGMKFTPEQCAKGLLDAIPRYAAPLQKCIKNFDKMPPFRQAAFISASYNLGPRTICRSTAVRRMNAGDEKGGCEALGAFIRANGVVLKGLVNRRQDSLWGEIAWCMETD